MDLRFVSKLPRLVPLDELRGTPALADMKLFKRSRLSVIPVTALEWKIITGLA